MRCYHRTDDSDAILRDGFRDGVGRYMTDTEFTGVWLSDRPLDANEGAVGDVVLSIEIPEEVVVPFEWVEEFKSYREFLVPAAIVNRYGPAAICDREG